MPFEAALQKRKHDSGLQNLGSLRAEYSVLKLSLNTEGRKNRQVILFT